MCYIKIISTLKNGGKENEQDESEILSVLWYAYGRVR